MAEKTSAFDDLPNENASTEAPTRIEEQIYLCKFPWKFETFRKMYAIIAYNETTKQSKVYDMSIWWSEKGGFEYGWTAFSSQIQGVMAPMLSAKHNEETTYQFSFAIFANLNITDESVWKFKVKEITSLEL